MPRLPRVISTACAPVRRSRSAAGLLEHLAGRRRCGCRAPAPLPPRSACTSSGRDSRAGDTASRRAAAPAGAAPGARAPSRWRGELGRDEPGAVVGQQRRRRSRRAPADSSLANARLTSSVSGQPVSRSIRTTCCFAECTPPARMRVFTGVRYCVDSHDVRASTPRGKLASSRRPSASAPTRPASERAAAERRDVVRRVARSAGHHLRRVVLQDQHRRLARHARRPRRR